MSGTSVGSVFVELELRQEKFISSLKAARAKAESEAKPITVDVDVSKTEAAIQSFYKKFRQMSRSELEQMQSDLRTQNAKTEQLVREYEARMDRLRKKALELEKLRRDQERAGRADEAKATRGKLGSVNMEMGRLRKQFAPFEEAYASQLNQLSAIRRVITVDVQPKADEGAAKVAGAKLKKAVGDISVTARAEIKDAQAQLAELRRALARAKVDAGEDGTKVAAVLRIDADVRQAEAKLDRLSARLAKTTDKSELGALTKQISSSATRAAADVQQAYGKLDTIFGQTEGKMRSARQELAAFTAGFRGSGGTVQTVSRAMASSLESPVAQIGILAGVAATAGAAFVAIATSFERAQQQLKLATKNSDEFASVQSKLFDVANANAQSVGETVNLYARLARAQDSLNLSGGELMQVTEAVAAATRLSGASAVQAQAGLMQLGQAFASNRLSGDELRSVMEQLPALSKSIADGLGVPIGELRRMGEAGELTGKKVADALLKQLPQLQKQSESAGYTLSQSFQLAQNSITRYVVELNDAIGVTGALANIVALVAKNFDGLVAIAVTAGIVFVGRAIEPMINAVRNFIAAETLRRATLVASTEATVAATAATTGLGRAIQFMGGPIGIAVMAALTGIALAVDRIRDRNKAAAEATAKLTDELQKLTEAESRQKRQELTATRTKLVGERDSLQGRIDAAYASGQPQAAHNATKQLKERVAELNQELAVNEKSLAIVNGRLDSFSQAAREAGRSLNTDLTKDIENADARMAILKKSGELSARAFDQASRSWKDASGNMRSFAQALNEGDKSAKERFDLTLKLVTKEEAFSSATKKSTDRTKEKADAFDDLIVATSAYADSLDDTVRPLVAFEKKQREVASQFDDLIRKMAPAKQAAARVAAGTVLDQLAEAGEKLRESEAAKLTEDLARILASQSLDAVAAIQREYADYVKELEAVAAKLDEVGTAESKLAAQRARAAIPQLEDQRDLFIEIERETKAFAEALETVTNFQSQFNANYKGATVTLADYERSLALLATEEVRLREIRDRAPAGTKARAAAEEALKKIIEERQRIEGQSNPEAVFTAAGASVEKFGNRLRNAAQAGLALAQVLGQGRSELAQMLAGVTSLGSGIAGLGEAAGKAGGFGKLFTTKSGVASAIPEVGQVVGGIIQITQAISALTKPSEEQVRALNANNAAIQQLMRSIGDLSSSLSGSTMRGVFTGIERLFGEGRTASNFLNLGVTKIGQKYNNYALNDPRLPDYVKIDPAKFFASVGTSMADVEAVAKQLGVTLDGTVGSYRKLQEAIAAADFAALNNSLSGLQKRLEIIAKINGTSGDPLEGIADKLRVLPSIAPELAKLFDVDEVFSEDGRKRLREKVAKLLRDVLNMDPNSEQAKDFVLNKLDGLNVNEFLDLFGSILTGIDDFGKGLSKVASPLEEFGMRAKLLGLEGAQYLENFIAVAGVQFKELQGLANGLDLNTTAGVEALRKRIIDLFNTIAENGITEAEQPLVNALMSIFDSLKALPSPAEAAAKALASLADQVGVLSELFEVNGTGFQEQVERISKSLGASFGGLFAKLFDGVDLNSDAGRDAFKKKIQKALSDILDDGVVSEAEKPIYEILKTLLGIANAAIDKATSDADDAAQVLIDKATKADEERNRKLSKFSDDAQILQTLFGLEGADAFYNSLSAFSEQFRSFLGEFDVTTWEGIGEAKQRLFQIRTDLLSLTDEQLVAKYGMTRDQIVAALLSIGGSLGEFGETLEDLATQQADFVTQMNLEYYDAFGMGLEAVKLQTEIWVEQMIATAKALNLLTPDMESRIRTIGNRRIENYQNSQSTASSGGNYTIHSGVTAADLAKMTPQERAEYARSSDRALLETFGVASGSLTSWSPEQAASAPEPNVRDEFVASDITKISETTALRMTDYLASGLVEWRRTADGIESLVGAFAGSSGVSRLLSPVLPARDVGGSGAFTLVLNFNGPLSGITPEEAGRRAAEEALPYLNAALARAAGIEARNAGRPSLS